MLLKALSVRALLPNESSEGCNLHTARLKTRINLSSKHHSQIRSGACAAKRDNFVAAVINTNENVSGHLLSAPGVLSKEHGHFSRSRSATKSRLARYRGLTKTNCSAAATCPQREIYGGLKIINYAKRYRRDRLRLVANGSCQHAQTRLGWRCWSLCMTNSRESYSVSVVAELIAISLVVEDSS